MTTQTKLIQYASFALLLLFYASILTVKIHFLPGEDLPRHIQNGRLILQGKTDVLFKNAYSYTNPDRPFINHHWLSGVVFAYIYTISGFSGLIALKIVVLLTMFALIFMTALRKASFFLVALCSIPTILILTERVAIRPEIFSYLFTALTLYLLSGLEKHPHSKKILWLIPIQLLWINMHVFAMVGPLIIAGYILTHPRQISKILLATLGGTLGISLANPHGVQGMLYAFTIFQDYGMNVIENQSIRSYQQTAVLGDDRALIVYTPIAILLFVSFCIRWKTWRDHLFFFGLSVTTFISGYMIIRTMPFFGIVLLPTLTANLNEIVRHIQGRMYAKMSNKQPLLRAGAYLILGAIILYGTFSALKGKILPYEQPGIGLTHGTQAAATFIRTNQLRGPIFNDFDIGSYLIFYLYPYERVFVDNRPEAYGKDFFQNIYLPLFQDEARWMSAQEQYHFNALVLYPYDSLDAFRDFLIRRINDPSWALVFADQHAVIFVKNTPSNHSLIEHEAYTPKNIGERVRHLSESPIPEDHIIAGDILSMFGRYDLAESVFLRIVERWPEKGKVWVTLAGLELVKNNADSSERAYHYLQRAHKAGYRNAHTYNLLGVAHLGLGQKTEALQALETAQHINPNSTENAIIRNNFERFFREK